ncbi:MAG: hypothetical protein RMK20_06870 [Verrucomicrobiales bacterium]|nr:hypothetical protein [Verrucomicrobiales bacterium]
MTPQTGSDWRALFAPATPERAATTVSLRLVRRGGEPFLILPREPALAARALALYPAQTLKARAAKTALLLALRCGLARGLETTTLALDAADPFVRFLCETVGLSVCELRLAALAGNPRAEGRRFVFLLFDAGGFPAAVVKAGNTDAARRLLAHEEHFLRAAPPRTRGLPVVRGALHTARVQAFAMDFVRGHAPRAEDLRPLVALLNDWLSRSAPVPLRELAAWQRLLAASAAAPLPDAVRELADLRVRTTLAHGDCAPWNVKVWRGEWTLLDWERGELAGVPGWDWLHFVLQPALLVRRESVPALLARLEATMASEAFGAYSRQAGFAGRERALALALVCYINCVIRPADGAETMRALEPAAAERWT